MQSFKQYQMLHESFGPLPLGLGRMSSIGMVGASLEEGKKKGCGKMDADDDAEEKAGVEVADEGDEECSKCGDDPCCCKKGKKEPEDKGDDEGGEEDKKPPFFSKKKSKKKMQSEGLFGKKLGKDPANAADLGLDDLGDEDLGDDEGGAGLSDDLGDDEADDLGDEDLGDDEADDLGDEDLGDEDLGDDEADDLGDEDLGDEDLGDDLPPPPKKGKKGPPAEAPAMDGPPMFMKKRSRKGMTKEQAQWWDSVEEQMNANPDPRFYDGFTEIEGQVQGDQPKPGDVGWAPQGKISWF